MEFKELEKLSVSDAFQSIGNEIKVIDVANGLGVSSRTVQKKIKSLGYKWHPQKCIYEPVLDTYNPDNDDKNFIEMFNNSGFKQLALSPKGEKTVTKNNKSVDTNKGIKASNGSELDMIDILLGSKKHTRVQRAYYIDKDLADIIDKVDGKQKSNLINECIRKVFTDKGIL